MFGEVGVKARTFRDPNDANSVGVLLEVPDVQKFESFMASPAARKAMPTLSASSTSSSTAAQRLCRASFTRPAAPASYSFVDRRRLMRSAPKHKSNVRKPGHSGRWPSEHPESDEDALARGVELVPPPRGRATAFVYPFQFAPQL